MNHLSRASPRTSNASEQIQREIMETGWNVLTHNFDSHEAKAENACYYQLFAEGSPSNGKRERRNKSGKGFKNNKGMRNMII